MNGSFLEKLLSAFVVLYDRAGAPVDSGRFESIMTRLKHRGPDGSDRLARGNLLMGHWHFWTTPEEVGERQPLELPGLPFTLVFDGRLDNRAELLAELGIPPAEGERLSDASLILHAYDRWGERCFEHFIGPFALVLWDASRQELFCVRDSLGDRTLFYTFKSTCLMIASEPWALTGDTPVLDAAGAAHYFALRAPADGRTLFKDVRELLPAQVLAVNPSGERRWQYWQADASRRLRYRSDEEYAEHFRSLLEQSVRCRMRCTTPVGVLMSGGLDSTSVACLAASMLAPAPLTTISFVFDELTACDERMYINAMQECWGLRSIQLPCDNLWPLKDWSNWPRNPNQPETSLYRLLHKGAWERASREGLRALLTGGFGDYLYSDRQDWLADLLVERRLLDAGRGLLAHARRAGWGRVWKSGSLQRVAGRLLRRLSGGRRLRRRPSPPPWLTPEAGCLLLEIEAGKPSLPDRLEAVAGLWAAYGSSRGLFDTSHYALELRHPYRDRRLIEFVLALPAHQLFYDGLYKHVLRNAMRGLLPEIIRSRPRGTSLGPLFFRGLEREKALLEACFRDTAAAWRRFVDGKWIANRWNVLPKEDNAEALVPWLCLAYEAWRQRCGLPSGNGSST